MQNKDIPQDPSVLDKFTTDVCYAVDENGNYTTKQSRGWEVKAKALDVTWQDINNRIKQTKQKVINGEASPILFFMELRLMDVSVVAAYTGFWKWTIKNHLKPHVLINFPKINYKNMPKFSTYLWIF